MLIDSNIILYALNSLSEKHKVARKLIYEDPHRYVVANQNIFECLRVLTHHVFPGVLSPKKAVSTLTKTIQFFSVISPTLGTYAIALELIKRHNVTGNNIFDAYLVATMMSNGVLVLYTDNDKHFRQFDTIKVINPFK